MKWVKVSDKMPQEGAIVRDIKTKHVINTERVYKWDAGYLEMDNDYEPNGINGAVYHYENLEWLDES